MAAHARLKNEFTEDEKYHNLMPWLIFPLLENFISMIIINAATIFVYTVETQQLFLFVLGAQHLCGHSQVLSHLMLCNLINTMQEKISTFDVMVTLRGFRKV